MRRTKPTSVITSLRHNIKQILMFGGILTSIRDLTRRRTKWAIWELSRQRFSTYGRTIPVLAICASACTHQFLCGDHGREPSLSQVITYRLADVRGGPRGAVSDVGDPTERLTSLAAFRLAKFTTLYGSQSDDDSAQEVSPDPVDFISFATSPPTSCSRTAGRISRNCFGPFPRRPRASFLWASRASHSRACSARGSWAAARLRLVRIISVLIS